MRILVAGLLMVASAGSVAHAINVAILIREVHADPSVQYVMLQMYAGGQNDLGGQVVKVFDAAGGPVGTLAFPTPFHLENAYSQSTVLIGTASVATTFGVSPDLVMPMPIIPASGGKICFDVFALDCVAWGNYVPAMPPDDSVGAPAAPGGIPPGMALRRDVSGGDNPNLLDPFGDDTNVSADDFDLVADPNPINNKTIPSTATSSTTTTTLRPGTATTSTTLPCPAEGIGAALCVLEAVPPAVCTGARFPRKVPNSLSSAASLMTRALGAASDKRRGKLVRKAAVRLKRASRATAKAGTGGKVTFECADALQAIVDDARGRLTPNP